MRVLVFCLTVFAFVVLTITGFAQVPQILNYQGRAVVGGTNYNGSANFKFALVSGDGAVTYWSNDGSSTGGSEPTAGVTLTVSKGLYSVQIGDTAIPNMTAILPVVFTNSDVRLRVWFDDGVHGSQLLAPDQRIAASAYAMMAENVRDGAISSAKLAEGAIGTSQIASSAVTSVHLASGSVGVDQIADFAVQGTHVATGAISTVHIVNEAITSALIASNAVTSLHLAVGSVGAVQLAEFAVQASRIATAAVGNAQLSADAVQAINIAAGAISSSKLAAGAVGTAHIADGAVTSALLASGAVNLIHLGAASVGSEQLVEFAVQSSHLATGAVGSVQMAEGAITSELIASGAVSAVNLADLAVQSAHIATGAVGTVQIAEGAITSNLIASGAVTSAHLATGAVESVHLANNAVLTSHISLGAVGSSQIAQGAITTALIASGAITAAQIAAGSIGSIELASNAIQSINIATGAITSAQLAKPPQSGSVPFTSLPLDFGPFDFTVVFNPSFATTPNVAISIETTSSVFGVSARTYVKTKSPSAFTGVCTQPFFDPVRVDTDPNAGKFSSLAIVNGNPAISYWDSGASNDLKYVRATAADGSSWGTPVRIDSPGNVGEFSSLTVINGRPAISYYDRTNADLKYVRAGDVDGATWMTPSSIDTPGDVGMACVLIPVDGNPAISYFETNTNGRLKYLRATNADGTAWGTPTVVDQIGLATFPASPPANSFSMAIINGNPAISYYSFTNGVLKYVRATDAIGSGWGTPSVLENVGTGIFAMSLAVVNGNPAVAYYNTTSKSLKYIRATNPDGTAWGAGLTVDSFVDVGQYCSLAVFNGTPAISYFESSGTNYLRYVRATDANGTTWGAPVRIDGPGVSVVHTSLRVVNGRPAISYFDNTKGLKFIRPNPPPFSINWIALEP